MSVHSERGWEEKQAEHYNRIAAQYEAHYSDTWSQRYRTRFLNEPMLSGIDLKGMQVLEAMCGSGQTTGHLLARGATVTGLDISSELIASFKKSWPSCEGICASIFETGLPAESYDVIVVVGGLHHLHPQVQRATDEIHRLLKPGGHFCFMEPHAGSLPDVIRRRWYKVDSMFEKNEESVDFEALYAANRDRFDLVRTRYLGNVAYLLVLNSLIFRVPLGLKKLYSPPLMAVERVLSPINSRLLSCFGVGQWRKRGAAAPAQAG
jgi:SAM-dependent methyltransferase